MIKSGDFSPTLRKLLGLYGLVVKDKNKPELTCNKKLTKIRHELLIHPAIHPLI